MKIEILSVRDPVWSNEGRSTIDCIVRFSHLKTEIPYTANQLDTEDHSRELFERCARGEFGPVAPFVPKDGNTGAVQGEEGGPAPDWQANWPELEIFLKEANAENERGTLRGIGLVWGAMLEDMLVRAMEKAGAENTHRGFKDKIRGAARANIITDQQRDAFYAVKEIRDRCAHDWRLSLENERVRQVLKDFEHLRRNYFADMKQTDDLEMLMRLVYSQACCRLIIDLAERP